MGCHIVKVRYNRYGHRKSKMFGLHFHTYQILRKKSYSINSKYKSAYTKALINMGGTLIEY